jgi:NDP-sugar pyrophosphorylase family protein
MKAVLLAAGKGKRMRELSRDMPKPMVPVRGKPILEHIITGLRDHAGIREFLIITGYLPQAVERHFQDGKAFGVSTSYARQEVQNGTGKAPELAKDWLAGSDFLLSYGDILIDPLQYRGLVDAHTADGVLAVKHADDLSKGGAAVLDENGLLKSLVEKPAPGTLTHAWYNCGIYIFTQKIFGYTARLELSLRGEYELTDALNAMARDGLELKGVELKGEWADVRDPETVAELNQAARS